MTGAIEFTSSVNLPDDREIHVSFRLPADHPTAAGQFLLDHTEFVQMAVATTLRNALRGDEAVAKLAAEKEVPF